MQLVPSHHLHMGVAVGRRKRNLFIWGFFLLALKNGILSDNSIATFHVVTANKHVMLLGPDGSACFHLSPPLSLLLPFLDGRGRVMGCAPYPSNSLWTYVMLNRIP